MILTMNMQILFIVEDYLRQSRIPKSGNNVTTLPAGGHVRDDEQVNVFFVEINI